MHNPLVTIVLTTYNRAHLISETLDSIIAQTYPFWKCMVIDDNSNDNTEEIVNKYVKKDKRFLYFKKENTYVKGLSASRNMGMDLIEKTDYIQFFDDDDIMHPQKLEIQLEEFNKNKHLDLTVFPTQNFRNTNELVIKEIQEYQSAIISNIGEEFLLAKTLFTAQVPLLKFSYVKNQRFKETLFYAEEWEFFNQLFFTKPTKASYVNKSLYFHRKHEVSITANLYDKNNPIREKSNTQAFLHVYKTIVGVNKLSGKLFGRFISHAVHSKYGKDLLQEIKQDLSIGKLFKKPKSKLILFLISYANQKKVILKIIHKIARW